MAVPSYIPINSVQVFLAYPCQHLLTVINLLIAISIVTILKLYLIVVLTYSSLMISDMHIFMCLLVICMFSLEKCLFRSSIHFFIKVVFWYCVVWTVFLYWIGEIFENYMTNNGLIFNMLPFCFVDSFLCCTKAFS